MKKNSLSLVSPFWGGVRKYKSLIWMLCCLAQALTNSKTIKELWFLLSSADAEGTFLWKALPWMPHSSVTYSSSSHYKSTLPLKLESVVIPLSGDTKTGAAQHHHTSQCSTPTCSKEQGPSAAPRIHRVQSKLVKINLILNISAQMAEFAMSLHKKRLFTSKHF